MGMITKCPDCGKLIALRFPVHNCTPKEKKMPRKYWYTRSSREDKISWLLKNQNLWEGWSYCGPFYDPRKKSIVDAMKKEGLFSEKTGWKDIDLDGLIREARKIRREGGKK